MFLGMCACFGVFSLTRKREVELAWLRTEGYNDSSCCAPKYAAGHAEERPAPWLKRNHAERMKLRIEAQYTRASARTQPGRHANSPNGRERENPKRERSAYPPACPDSSCEDRNYELEVDRGADRRPEGT